MLSSLSRELVARWRAMDFAAAVSVWADPRMQFLWARAGVPQRIGFPATRINLYGSHLPGRTRNLTLSRLLSPFLRVFTAGRGLLTMPLHRDPKNPHQLGAWEQIASGLNLRWNKETPWISKKALEGVSAALDNLKFEGKNVLLAHTGGRLPTKRWSAGFWEVTLATLRQRLPDWQLCVLAGPDDPPPPMIPGVLQLQAPHGAAELAAMLAKADFVLANDSFPAHLAHAVGTRVLAIFGSGDPAWFVPGADPSNGISANVCPWRPCLDECRMSSTICLEQLHPELVINTVLGRISFNHTPSQS